MPATLTECVQAIKHRRQELVPATLYDAWKKRDPIFDTFDFYSTFALLKILEGKTYEPQCELHTFVEVVSAFFAFVDHYVGEISHVAAIRYLNIHEKSNYEWAREKVRNYVLKGEKISNEMKQCLRFAEQNFDLKQSPLLAPKRNSSTMSGVGSVVKDHNAWLTADHSESMRKAADRSRRIK